MPFMGWKMALLNYLLAPLLTLVVVIDMIEDFILKHWMSMLILFFCLGAAVAGVYF